MTIEAEDHVRVTCNFELGDGSQYQNIYSYIRSGVDVVSDPDTVVAIKTRMEAMYDELVSETTADVTERLSFVDQVEWVVDEWKVVANVGVFTPSFVPVAAGDALPYQCAPFLIFKTSRPKSVGKKFLFPFDEAFQADSILTAPAIASMVSYGVLAIANVSLGGDAILTPGIFRTGVHQWLSFDTAVVNDVIGSQKRRRPGVGA